MSLLVHVKDCAGIFTCQDVCAQLGRRRRNAVQEVCMYRGACVIQCSRYTVPLNEGTYNKSPSQTVSTLRRSSQNGGGNVASHMRLEVDSSKFGERSDDHMAVTCLSKAVTIHFPKGRCMIRPDTSPAPTFSRELGTPFRRFTLRLEEQLGTKLCLLLYYGRWLSPRPCSF